MSFFPTRRQDLAKVINDGLYYYEEGLWDDEDDGSEDLLGDNEDSWTIDCQTADSANVQERIHQPSFP